MPRGIPSLDWILTEVKKQLDDFSEQKIIPTLREMFYTLVELGVMPKTEVFYKALSGHTARWRENGILPIDCFVDEGRRIVDINDIYEPVTDYVRRLTNYLRFILEYYNIPRWHNQPNYVEVWIEKNSAIKSIVSIVEGLAVRVVPNSGHASVAYFSKNVQRLLRKQREGKRICIIYCGDCDPSGEVMPLVYKRKFNEYRLEDIHFIPLAVTMQQVKRFKLLTDPDPLTLAKLQNDTNRFRFMEKYDLTEEELFAVQLEAMFTPSVRRYFKELLRDTIIGLFDNDVYEEAQKKKPKPKQIKRLVLTEINELSEQLNEELG